MKTTRKMLEMMVEQLNASLGRPKEQFTRKDSTGVSNIGHLRLDHDGSGYTLEEIITTGGGVTHPLTHRRLTANEMWLVLYAAKQIIQFDTLKPWGKQ
jgi:hypothetical protein